ncbi:redox-regulated ATPase YchF [archaeon]|jgi:ribosome-binding ATPase|nr:redox-regulated ATPase YchF [archaeon]MBT6606658.1 redox-regulated ATPase YchF [archaeon]MBT7251901.1 redox-regulated ATPase YchF [archaeon]MBT7660591.1 redox-regulated ATPase YchF [archaeon]
MLLGLVGKPSSGKSTFFKSATLADVLIASYPFATIEPNHGMGYVRVKALCKELNTKCNPRTGFCTGETRFVPVELMDVAGLVQGASEGKGLGNQFLDTLRQADSFIQIVDISGTTDIEGKEGTGDPIEDVKMLENELNKWYRGIFEKVWEKLSRSLQTTKSDFAKAIATQFSGLKVTEDDVKRVLLKLKLDPEKPTSWSEEDLANFTKTLRHSTKPMIIAANKIDKPTAEENLKKLQVAFPEIKIIPCSADSELSLRQAANAKMIEYVQGDSTLKINEEKVNEKQKEALGSIQKNVLDKFGSTGVQEVLDYAIFDLLKYIAIFPAGSKLADSKGNILPDCFLLPGGSTALNFAYSLHTDIGDKFVKAIDVRTKTAVGKDHPLKNRDGIEIMTS